MCDDDAMNTEGINLLQLIGKRYPVPQTNTPYFEPTLAERRKALKKQPNYYIMRKPGQAVADKAPTQESPAQQ